jgi:signal transduction histidine kinase
LTAQTRHEVLRIVNEALLNAGRHGGAATATVWLGEEGDELALRVSDDGSGLRDAVDLERLKADGHFGLAGMHERARAIGGSLSLGRGQERGTHVTLRLPCPVDRLASEPAPPAAAVGWPRARVRLLPARYRRPRSARVRA